MFARLELEKYFKYESIAGWNILFQSWGLETVFDFSLGFLYMHSLFLYETQSSTTQSVEKSSKARGTEKKKKKQWAS